MVLGKGGGEESALTVRERVKKYTSLNLSTAIVDIHLFYDGPVDINPCNENLVLSL